MAVSNLLSNTFFFNLKGPSPDRKRLSGRYDLSSKVYVSLHKNISKLRVGTQLEMNDALCRRRRRNSILSREKDKEEAECECESREVWWTIYQQRWPRDFPHHQGLVLNILLQDFMFMQHCQPLGKLTTFIEVLSRWEKTWVQIIERRLLPVCISAKAE